MSVVSTGVSANDGTSTSLKTTKTGNVASLTPVAEIKTAFDTHGNVFKVPDYTIKEILSAIPKECYERSLVRSMGYVVRDIVAMVAIGYVGMNFIPLIPHPALRFVAWNLYSYSLGLFGFGLWILAHECGHSAFSDYNVVNDFVGWVLHSYLMVPYFSWKFSHSKHHKATGHLTKDMVFIPYTREEFLEKRGVLKISEVMEDSPIWSLSVLIFQQLGGLSTYLASNATGQTLPGYTWWYKSHYNPISPVFDKKDFWFVILSDIGIISTLTAVYLWYCAYGWFNVLVNWYVPWLWVNHWLVFVTFLQHTDPSMPHYDNDQWTFAKGAAATIDRDYGFIGQHIFHDIIETHVLHHYVSRIPFYNAREASAAIRKVMGEHYRYDGENMWLSLWKVMRSCQFVDGEGVRMYRNVNGVGIKPLD